MKILITSVGDTDPIRNYHDGAILHICRVERPDKVILIHSEHTLHKHDDIVYTIQAIPDYDPTIIKSHEILSNDEVFLFDVMYERIDSIINYYINSEKGKSEILLNLSSSTPQIISAFYTINRVKDYRFKAIQVTTPAKASNISVDYNLDDSIDIQIEFNEDNVDDFVNRCRIDTGTNLIHSLVGRQLRNLITDYDYQVAYDILKEHKAYPNRNRLMKDLLNTYKNIQTQTLPEKIEKLEINRELKKALHYYLILDIKRQRGEVVDVLIRLKSLGEFLMSRYLSRKYKDIFDKSRNTYYLNTKNYSEVYQYINNSYPYKDWNRRVSLSHYLKICEYLKESESILEPLIKINKINDMRNSVAHNLTSIDDKEFVEIDRACKAARDLLEEVYDFETKHLYYYEDLNKDLLALLT